MSFAAIPADEAAIAADDEYGEVLLTTPRTFQRRWVGQPRFRTAAAGLLTVGGLALVLMALVGSHAPPRSALHGVIGLDKIHDAVLNVTIRDFKKSGTKGGHDDMMPSYGHVKRGLQKGLVKAELGPDNKPVFVGKDVDEGITKGLTTKENFDMWYNDVPGVNKKVEEQIQMRVKSNGQLVYEDHKFFPVDGKGWKDTSNCTGCDNHNYYFTLEMFKEFTYFGGEKFKFRGDDDIWVFINKKLVVDLGGMHEELEGSVALDDLGLEKHSINQFHLFFAERHPTESNFRVETSIRLDQTVLLGGPGYEGPKCCVIYLSFFEIVCAPAAEKQWYHFMCTE